jgi:hypothetical protein
MTNAELDPRQREACCRNLGSTLISQPFAALRPCAMRACWRAMYFQDDAVTDTDGFPPKWWQELRTGLPPANSWARTQR